jgi:hypothetical protein
MPVTRIEVLDCMEDQTGSLNLRLHFLNLSQSPRLAHTPGGSPPRTERHRLRDPRTCAEVVDQVRDDMRGTSLPSEPQVLLIQHVAIQAQA